MISYMAWLIGNTDDIPVFSFTGVMGGWGGGGGWVGWKQALAQYARMDFSLTKPTQS